MLKENATPIRSCARLPASSSPLPAEPASIERLLALGARAYVTSLDIVQFLKAVDGCLLFTIDEASELTHLSRTWWRRAVTYGRVASVKLGGAIRIPAREVARLIAESERPPFERPVR